MTCHTVPCRLPTPNHCLCMWWRSSKNMNVECTPNYSVWRNAALFCLRIFSITWMDGYHGKCHAGKLTGERCSAQIEWRLNENGYSAWTRWIFHGKNVNMNRNCRFRRNDTRQVRCSKMFRSSESGLIWWWPSMNLCGVHCVDCWLWRMHATYTLSVLMRATSTHSHSHSRETRTKHTFHFVLHAHVSFCCAVVLFDFDYDRNEMKIAWMKSLKHMRHGMILVHLRWCTMCTGKTMGVCTEAQSLVPGAHAHRRKLAIGKLNWMTLQRQCQLYIFSLYAASVGSMCLYYSQSLHPVVFVRLHRRNVTVNNKSVIWSRRFFLCSASLVGIFSNHFFVLSSVSARLDAFFLVSNIPSLLSQRLASITCLKQRGKQCINTQ